MKKLLIYLLLLFGLPLVAVSYATPPTAPQTSGSASISDTAYNEGTWDGVTTTAPSKNAVRDKIETMGGTDDQTAAEVVFTPAGDIAAEQVQAAIEELDGEKEAADATILKEADVDDVPVDGVTTAPVSSNRMYDHENNADQHPEYMTPAEHTAAVGAAYDTEVELNALFALYVTLAALGENYDTSAEFDALFAAKEDTLINEAGLYSALSDVSDFVQPDEKFTMGATIQETGNADTTPDVSNAATGVNNIYRSNENGTITDFDDGDDHSEFSDGDFFVFIVDDASTVIDFSENSNIEGNAGVDFTGSATQITTILFQYYDARWNAVNLTGGYSSPTTLGLTSIEMGSGTLEIPNDESADKALGNLGEVHIRGDEDTFNAHFGSGGEIAGEASISAVYMFTMPIDFTYVYDRDANHRIHLFEVNSKVYPNGITIDYIRVTYTKDPTTELDADLMRADDIIGVANAAKLDDLITVSGSFIEDTDTNINTDGSVIAAGQDIYIQINADPVDEDVLANVTILFHAEAD